MVFLRWIIYCHTYVSVRFVPLELLETIRPFFFFFYKCTHASTPSDLTNESSESNEYIRYASLKDQVLMNSTLSMREYQVKKNSLGYFSVQYLYVKVTSVKRVKWKSIVIHCKMEDCNQTWTVMGIKPCVAPPALARLGGTLYI